MKRPGIQLEDTCCCFWVYYNKLHFFSSGLSPHSCFAQQTFSQLSSYENLSYSYKNNTLHKNLTPLYKVLNFNLK